MKKILALLLALVMLMSLAACGDTKKDSKDDDSTKAPTEAPTEPEEKPADPSEPEVENYKKISVLSMGMNGLMMDAQDNGDGTMILAVSTADAFLSGTMDVAGMDTIAKALAETNYEELVAPDAEDWMGSAYMGITYVDEEEVPFAYECYTTVPEDFVAVYEAMEACLLELAKQLPEGEPGQDGTIAENDLAAINEILDNTELWTTRNQFSISGRTPADEDFAWVVGLPSADGVVSGLRFGPNVGTTPYALYIVTAEGDANAIAQSYKDNIDWHIFMCTNPDQALIATKGNQVLYLIAADDQYAATAAGIEAAGWTVYATEVNPDMAG